MSELLALWVLDQVSDYIDRISDEERFKITGAIEILRTGDFQLVHTKQLRGPIRELIIKSHRITFFKHENTLCFISAFQKKSAKTPRRELEYAESLYKKIILYDL